MPFFGVPIRNGLPIGLGSVAGFGVQQFDPSQLFEGGTVAGAWYDPSDLSTLFTTSAGTTQCAMPGQGSAVPVGLMLDKSQGLVLGPELVTNGNFSSGTTGWTAQASNNIAVVGGELEITLNSALFSGAAGTSYTLVPGRWYVATATARRGTSAANVTVRFGSGVGEGDLTFTTTSNVTQTRYFVATTTTTTPTVTTSSSSGSGTIYADNISIRELPGNHAIAFNNTTARPELRARVNLLTYSEEFDNGAWTKAGLNAFGSGSVANTTATLDPLGGNTADYIQENSTNAPHYVFSTGGISVNAATYQGFVYAKAAERSRLVMGIWNGTNYELCQFDLTNGVILQEATPGIASIESAGNGWWKCGVSRTIGATTTYLSFGPYINANISTLTGVWTNAAYTGDGTSGIYIWGADLRPANIGANVPAYQRIADALTYDTSGFPLYLRFDGIDDSMYTPANLNLSGTDKVAVFAGVRKLSDAAAAILTELSAVSATTNGSFSVVASTIDGGADRLSYGFNARGTVTSVVRTARSYAAPITNVVTAQYDNAAATIPTQIVMRVNGVTPTTQADPFGPTSAGNFGTHPLYIGARNNSSLWFNGNIYSLIIAGSAVSAGNISATEQWVAQKTGIAI